MRTPVAPVVKKACSTPPNGFFKLPTMTDFFKDKNVLALYPVEDTVFPMRFSPLKRYFKSVHLLNYTEVCHAEGIKSAERRIRNAIAEKK